MPEHAGHNVTFYNSTVHENVDKSEAFYLFIMATSGMFFNALIILMVFARKSLRKMTSAFIIHGSILDIIKCAYCIPFGLSILTHKAPHFCELLGGSFVIIISSFVFNLVAMICSEAYMFGEETFGRPSSKGNFCCIGFGLVMIYAGSLILHLGPTIVGGSFNYNQILSQCVFVYGEIRSYVVYVMWVVVTTLSVIAAMHYVWVLNKNINTQHHNHFSESRSSLHEHPNDHRLPPHQVRRLVKDAYSRVRCYTVLVVIFVLTWYPLFIITLADPGFKMPPVLYSTLTLIAWSNGALNPIILLLVDNKFNVLRQLLCKYCDKNKSKMDTSFPLMPGGLGQMQMSSQMFERVGCRLCQEGTTHSTNLCNGRLGNGRLVRDNSFCELHTIYSLS
ncbi:uncharacterized protein LOC135482526 [Lineus longissimus]|uniref:uncharacterized protein LOC135482526 n=1 Tax=Lineus longissimus TaxID=88925 RepID=UPI002B4F9711